MLELCVPSLVFQKTIAGSHDVDVVYGPDDKIKPVIINWNNEQTVTLTVRLFDLNRKEIFKKEYKNILLEGGRTVRTLEPFHPGSFDEGYYFVVYEIN